MKNRRVVYRFAHQGPHCPSFSDAACDPRCPVYSMCRGDHLRKDREMVDRNIRDYERELIRVCEAIA